MQVAPLSHPLRTLNVYGVVLACGRVTCIVGAVLLLLSCASSCGRDVGQVPAVNEVVMRQGNRITAKFPKVRLEIEAIAPLERRYTWNGESRVAELIPRKERWYGSLGLYNPGMSRMWQEHDGVNAGILEEGVQHFKSIEDAEKWLLEREMVEVVYSDDGLVVCFGLNPSRQQADIQVWQIMINGSKPSKLAGAGADLVTIN